MAGDGRPFFTEGFFSEGFFATTFFGEEDPPEPSPSARRVTGVLLLKLLRRRR